MIEKFPADSLSSILTDGLVRLGIKNPGRLEESCLKYLELLGLWNEAYNLTAIRDYRKMVSHHLLDSLALHQFIKGSPCLDIGTGAGLPGLVLAMANPEINWILLDSNHKKIRFVNQVCIELELDNVETICSRVEKFVPIEPISTMVCRAFAGLDDIVSQTKHLFSTNTRLLAMKGRNCMKEVQKLERSPDFATFYTQVIKLDIPGVAEERSLVEIKSSTSQF